MADPNLVDFYGRIARIETARSKGMGFEAAGTLGRSYYYRAAKKRRPVIAPVLFLALSLFVLKGAVLNAVGSDIYDGRVAGLMASEGFDRFGGWMMQSDPVTVFTAGKIGEVVARFD